MKLILLSVILLIGFSQTILATQEKFYIQWPWETFTTKAEILNGNIIKSLQEQATITSYPAELLTSGTQWQVTLSELKPGSLVCMGAYALMNLNDLKFSPEQDSTAKAVGVCSDGQFLTSWGQIQQRGVFQPSVGSVVSFRFSTKFIEVKSNGFNANFTINKERAYVPWIQINGVADVQTETIFIPWAWTSPSENAYVSGGLIQSNDKSFDKSVHAFFSQPLPVGARWRMTIDKYQKSGQICFGIYGKKYLGEFYEYPSQDLSKMGAAACSDGKTHNWWGAFDQKGAITDILDHSVFYFSLQKDHITIESQDKTFIVKFMLESFPENLQYIPWVEMRGDWKVQLVSLKKEPKNYVMRKSKLQDIMTPEQIEAAKVQAAADYEKFIAEGGKAEAFTGYSSTPSEQQQPVDEQSLDQAAAQPINDELENGQEDITKEEAMTNPTDDSAAPEGLQQQTTTTPQPQPQKQQQPAPSAQQSSSSQQSKQQQQPKTQQPADASTNTPQVQQPKQQDGQQQGQPAKTQQPSATNFVKVKEGAINPKFHVGFGFHKKHLIRKNAN